MPLVSYALIDLVSTKLFLGITGATYDVLLENAINAATDYIETKTGRRFTSAVNTSEKIDGTGTNQIKLKRFPIIVPPAVILEVNNTSDNTDSWSTIDTATYWVDTDTGIITRTSGFLNFDEATEDDEAISETIFTRGKQKYRVTYTSGFATVPYDIQYACLMLIGQIFNTKKSQGIKSESLGDHSVTFADISGIEGQGMFNDILSRYRDIPLA